MQAHRIKMCFLACLTVLAGCEPMQVEGPALSTEGKTSAIIGGSNYDGVQAVGALLSSNSLCTATLVTPTRLLTAAHCVYNRHPSDLEFVTGPNSNAPRTRTRAARAVYHRSYNPRTLDHDVAYVDLVSAPPGITPINVVRSMNSSWNGRDLLFVGYGESNGIAETGAGFKRAVAMPIRDIEATKFWFGNSGRNVCSGDSGGAALYRTPSGAYEIAGIHSGADENCTMFGVDMRVDVYVDSFFGLPAAAAPTPAPSTPAPSTPAPSTPAPSTPTADTMRAQNVTLAAGVANYYDAIPVRPGTPFRAVLQGSGDADLYVRWGGRPSDEAFDCRPYASNSSEVCELTVPAGVTSAYVAVGAYLTSTYWLNINYQY